MRKWMGLLVGLVVVVAIVWALLPEGYVIRGPLLDHMLGRGIEAPAAEVVDERFELPPGYAVTLWAQGLPNARFLRFSPDGSLIVAQTGPGQVTHVQGDRDGDGFSDGHRVLLAGLDRPHGIDFHDGHLYIGEAAAIARVVFGESGPDTIAIDATPERIATGIPEGGNHWRRSLRVGPDGRIYLTVGSTCNVCEEEDPRRAAMLRYEADGSNETLFATGLRNAVGFDWQPGTGDLYATDNGRDLLGDDYPACELNRVVEGGFYGWPYANANLEGETEPDPDLGTGHEALVAKTIRAVHAFRAHTAPLGITFVRHPEADPMLRGAALVALHGSWNRSQLDGYEVVSLHWDEDGRVTERSFLKGFERDGDVIGRPVDVAEGPDGAFYVSDDYAGTIYRVALAGDSPAAGTTRPRAAAEGTPIAGATGDPLAALDAATRAGLAERGASLFEANACATCHDPASAAPGVTLKELENLGARYDVDRLAAYFLAPQPPMPAFDLPEEDRRALAVHLLAQDAN